MGKERIRDRSLNGEWDVRIGGEWKKIEVPSAIETILEQKDEYGPFLYKKEIAIQKEAGLRYVLQFEGVSYYCKVFCNGKKVSEHEGIWDSFQADITEYVEDGGNEISLEVTKPDFDKESPYYFRSVLFGFIPDVLFPFGGIWKDVTLHVTGGQYFEEVTPKFCFDDSCIAIQSNITGHEGKTPDGSCALCLKVETPDGETFEIWEAYQKECRFKLTSFTPWSPKNPNVYRCELSLCRNGSVLDSRTFTGGFREISAADGVIKINGQPYYMRGVLHWGYDPEKMAPNPTYDEVKKELQKLKALGFNTVKHCLYFPPRYYYELCDEMGIVIWQELPLWLPFKNEYLMERIYTQYPRMLDSFMQYPCVVVVSIGCELDATVGSSVLNRLYQMIKERDATVFVCDNSGSGECFGGEKDSKSDIYDYHFYAELYQLGQLIHEFTAGYREKKPWVFGEYNDSDTYRVIEQNQTGKEVWWCSPDERINPLRKVHKGFGSDQPIYRQQEIMNAYKMTEAEKAHVKEISVEQMKEVRKFILETTRSVPEIQGYNITTIRDVPITTSGIFDDRMESKMDEGLMGQINGDIVVSFQKELSRVWERGADRFLNQDRFNYESGGNVNGRFVLSNQSDNALQGKMTVTVGTKEAVWDRCEKEFASNPHQVIGLPEVNLSVAHTDSTLNGTIRVELTYDGGVYSNEWPIWVYGKTRTETPVYVLDFGTYFQELEAKFQVTRLSGFADAEKLHAGDILLTTVGHLEADRLRAKGIHVILCITGTDYLPVCEVPFYREGVAAVMKHPVMEMLAPRGFAGLQFFGIASGLALDKIELEKQGVTYHSLMRRYDARNFKVSEYLIECTGQKGRGFITTLNLAGGAGEQPDKLVQNHVGIQLLHAMICRLTEETQDEKQDETSGINK